MSTSYIKICKLKLLFNSSILTMLILWEQPVYEKQPFQKSTNIFVHNTKRIIIIILPI